MQLPAKLLLGCLLLTTPALAEVTRVTEFDDLMRQYGNDVQLSAGAIYEAGVSELQQKYTAAIDRALKAAQEAGKLEEALAFKNEAKLIADGGDPAAEDASLQPEVQKLRTIYRQTMARLEQDRSAATNPVISALNASLDRLIVTLTKAGRLDEAVFVKQKKDNLGKEIAQATAKAAADVSAPPRKGEFTNTLGMRFVPVPGTDVLMCIHQTRNADYALYAAAVPGVKASPVYAPPVPAEKSGEHPVRNERYIDAVGFCDWLSKKEGKTYRLPTDQEWSDAVGIGTEEKRTENSTPESLAGKIKTEFPWGTEWPPPEGAGNYADSAWKQEFPKETCIEGYTDGFPVTSPVMSFKPNKLGLYDMGSNVSEWVADWWNADQKDRTFRGAGFGTKVRNGLLSSARGHLAPAVGYGNANVGFRCVLETKP
jgi:formylglycine-generating enzyme required for sulfatase activity